MAHRALLPLLTLILGACGEGFDLDPGLGSAAPQVGAPSAEAYRHVIAAGDLGTWIVLHPEPAAEWARGEPRLVARGFPSVLVREVDQSLLPQAVASWRGRTVHALDTRGPRCNAEVGEFALVGRLMYEDDAESIDDHDTSRSRANDQAHIRELWQMATPVLAAQLRPLSGDCAGATWARVADTAAPAVSAAQPAASALREAALAAFTRLPAYRIVEQRYEEWREDMHATEARGVPWERYGGVEPEVSLLREASSGVNIVAVSVSTPDGCGGSGGRLVAIWRINDRADLRRESEQLELIGALEDDRRPLAIVDLEGDGQPEVLFDGGVFFATGTGLGVVEPVPVASYICPC